MTLTNAQLVALDALREAFDEATVARMVKATDATWWAAMGRLADAAGVTFGMLERDMWCPACDAGDFMPHREDCELQQDLLYVGYLTPPTKP